MLLPSRDSQVPVTMLKPTSSSEPEQGLRGRECRANLGYDTQAEREWQSLPLSLASM